jgi:hypothetical protein
MKAHPKRDNEMSFLLTDSVPLTRQTASSPGRDGRSAVQIGVPERWAVP